MFGNEPEPPDRKFASTLSNLLTRVCNLAESVYLSHQLGFPNIMVAAYLPLTYFIQQLETFTPSVHLSNMGLDQDIANVKECLISLFTTGKEMEKWLREQMGTSYHPRAARLKVTSVQDLPKAKISLPAWVQNPQYQSLLKLSSELMDKLIQSTVHAFGKIEAMRGGPGIDAVSDYYEWDTKKRLACLQVIIQEGIGSVKRAITVLPTKSERRDRWAKAQEQLDREIEQSKSDIEFGDQRAKDLIDAAEDKYPKQAIKLLHRALRYGHTGIQASKAYMGLGMRYEQLGDIALAIEYYTKSIEAKGGLNPYTFLWRGELYYRQRQLEKARDDFEQVIALEPFSREFEQAEKYLAELNQLIGDKNHQM